MTSAPGGGGKLPGKTKYAGRRRAMTRRSGFSVHPDTTGGQFRRSAETTYFLQRGDTVTVEFSMVGHRAGDLLGYGVWFWHTMGVTRTITGGPEARTLTDFSDDSWNKAGSIWRAESANAVTVTFTLMATKPSEVAVYAPLCGRVSHTHLTNARKVLLRNMYQFAPEAVFVDEEIDAEAEVVVPENCLTGQHELTRKSCNRCGRYLPINVPLERNHLSFSNHCVAAHRRPCRHSTFSRLRNVDFPDEILELDFGFQLECRFCKKFEVNAAHNPQRTSAQMKEDGARRRAFEFLLENLYGGTPNLRYRHEHGTELADDVWNRFGHKCFNCGAALPTIRSMHLDHTRPLALLWPLDGTATALCGPCNSEKRDRAPADFYPIKKLKALSSLTGIPLAELGDPRPNEDAIDRLLSRLDWFYTDFLTRDEMIRERDGKIAGELVLKALQKVLAQSTRRRTVDLQREYERRRRWWVDESSTPTD